MDQPIKELPIKTFFDADPWRARIFFIGALWWFPFLVYGGSIYAYYGFETPPAYFRLDIVDNVQWFVLNVTRPLAVATIIIAVLYILLGRLFRVRSIPFIGMIFFNPTSIIITLLISFMAYWGVILLLVYEGMKKFVRWARGEGAIVNGKS